MFAGVAAAFTIHVAIAVAAGSTLTLLPHRIVETVVAVLFLLGAFLLWRESRDDQDAESQEEPCAAAIADGAGFWKVASAGISVIVVAEWGDLTQILTANVAVKYNDRLAVGLGAVLALWSVALLAMLAGTTLLRVLPMKWITRTAALIMLALASYSGLTAART